MSVLFDERKLIVGKAQGNAFLALRCAIECFRSNVATCLVISGSRRLPIAACDRGLRIYDGFADLAIGCRLHVITMSVFI
jgi:hypothetical protein